MNTYQNVYISLGSNKGDKFKNLQDAITSIYLRIGNIKIISKVYKSPALGFEGDYFLNTCLILETEFKPTKVMRELIAIEKSLGRTRPKDKGYESRTIDLDIIFYGDVVMESKTLKLPHPEMHKRKFVLQPLSDIAHEVVHPKKKRKVSDLLDECKDKSEIESINIWLKNLTFLQKNY